jgi:CRP/FNR family cyclic AMP-dependent transcriptional regulator
MYHPLEDINSVISILSRISVWGGLTDEQQAEIYQRLEVGTFRKGEYVFHKGDEPSHIYIVKSGRIEITTSDQGVSVQKEAVETGGCFGVIALMAVQTYTATAIAAEDTEVMVLSRKALLGLYHEDIRLFALLIMNIAREIARKLTITDEVLLQWVHECKDGELTQYR